MDGLLRVSEGTFNAFVDQKSFYKHVESNSYSRDQLVDRVRAMINRGYIEAVEESGSRSIRLTRKGKIKRLEKSTNQEIDGKWRFISFDIPEKLKTLRLRLARSLRRIGYKSVQKSLWACPFIKANEVNLILEELCLRSYVAYFVVEKTDIKEHLEELFPEVFE